jgi:acetyl-CoA C-acetyltransferase
MREAVIVSAVRTPLGSFNGSLAPISAQPIWGPARHQGGRQAGGYRLTDVDEVHHGHGSALRLRPEPGQTGGRQGGSAG